MMQERPREISDQANLIAPRKAQLEEGAERTNAELIRLRQDYIKARRETFYWRQQAEERCQQVDQLLLELEAFYRSFSYRRYRLFALLRTHKRYFFPLAGVALACLVSAPALLMLLPFPSGRRALKWLALKSVTLRELMEIASEHNVVAENKARGKARKALPIILRRPVAVSEEFNTMTSAPRRAFHYAQLSPQARYKLAKLGVEHDLCKSPEEASAVRSLERSEISLQRASFAAMAQSSGQE